MMTNPRQLVWLVMLCSSAAAGAAQPPPSAATAASASTQAPVSASPSGPAASLAATAFVRAGQVIAVMVADEDMQVVTRATALASGQLGDVVRARLAGSGHVVVVRIIAPGQAVILGLKPEN